MTICAECGQPIQNVAQSPVAGAKSYHGACYRMAFPPEHPEEWPKQISQSPHEDDEWADHHGR